MTTEEQQSPLSDQEASAVVDAVTLSGTPQNTPKAVTEEDGDQPPMPPLRYEDGTRVQ